MSTSSFALQSAWDLWWRTWHWDRFSIAIIILSMIHTHLFICHQLCTVLTTDSAVKYHTLSSVQTRKVQLWGGHLSTFLCVMSGFRRNVHEICDHLESYAASSGNPISTFRANLSDPSSRVSAEW